MTLPNELLKRMGIVPLSLEAFTNHEDGAPYEVWRVETEAGPFVLKKAKGHELPIYLSFLNEPLAGAPRLLKTAAWKGEDYLLLKYCEGEDLLRLDREALIKTIDALVSLQERFWENEGMAGIGLTVSAAFEKVKERGRYLGDAVPEEAYRAFLALFERLPRTLCHGDLLPFNVRLSEREAVLLDWEVGGILPYLLPLARLLAHAEEKECALFFVKEADKDFAIDYYYKKLPGPKGIAYSDYRRTLDYFFLYEYCEWIMLGNRYPDVDAERYRSYCEKAKRLLDALT